MFQKMFSLTMFSFFIATQTLAHQTIDDSLPTKLVPILECYSVNRSTQINFYASKALKDGENFYKGSLLVQAKSGENIQRDLTSYGISFTGAHTLNLQVKLSEGKTFSIGITGIDDFIDEVEIPVYAPSEKLRCDDLDLHSIL